MENRFYLLKAGILIVALVIAGLSSGFEPSKLTDRLNAVHYNAAAYAGTFMHQTSHSVAAELSRLLGKLR